MSDNEKLFDAVRRMHEHFAQKYQQEMNGREPTSVPLWSRIKAYGFRLTPYLLHGLIYLFCLFFWWYLCAIGEFFLSSLLEQDVPPHIMRILEFAVDAVLFILWMVPFALLDFAPDSRLAKASIAPLVGVVDWLEESPKIRGAILFGFLIGLNVILAWHAAPEAKWSARFFLALAVVLTLRVNWPRYWRGFPARLRIALFDKEFRDMVLIAAAMIAAGTLIGTYGGDFTDLGSIPKLLGYGFAGFAVLFALVLLLFVPVEAPRDGADAVRDQTTYGDAKPADADDLHTALQGKSADGRKRSAEPSHDFDYPD